MKLNLTEPSGEKRVDQSFFWQAKKKKKNSKQISKWVSN